MDEYDDLGTYNGEPEHDMWVDFDCNENTGELSDVSMTLVWMTILMTVHIGIRMSKQSFATT